MTAGVRPPSAADLRPERQQLASVRVGQALVVAILAIGYVVNSSGLIAYNKFLIDRDRFPFAVPLVFLHSVFCSSLALALYCIKPSLFPALSDPEQRVPVDERLILRGALPSGVFFSLQLTLSNSAFLHSSVAFIQMMKEGNLALVYTMSLVLALESFSWRNAALLVAVVFATLMTIHGELNFSAIGFALQGVSQLFECTKIVLQAMLLSTPGRKLDALTYVLLVMPICAAILGVSLCCIFAWSQHSAWLIPTYAHVQVWWPHLLGNSLLAFSLNVIIALLVKNCSAVGFILVGMVKDAMIVISGVLLLSEVISRMQAVGFALQLTLILVYTLVKTFPAEFEHGVLLGLTRLIAGGGFGEQELKVALPFDVGHAPLVHAAAKNDYGALAEAGEVHNGKGAVQAPVPQRLFAGELPGS